MTLQADRRTTKPSVTRIRVLPCESRTVTPRRLRRSCGGGDRCVCVQVVGWGVAGMLGELRRLRFGETDGAVHPGGERGGAEGPEAQRLQTRAPARVAVLLQHARALPCRLGRWRLVQGGCTPSESWCFMACVNALLPLQCSRTCGGGVRRRNVTCSRNTGADCEPRRKPPAVSPCRLQECPAVGDVDWSGSGSSSDVLNEINSVHEAKPPRAQAVNADAAAEGEFHHNNKIENIDPVVHVDDFYYDYNFIDFHEDLSDDFDGGESNGSQQDESTGGVKDTTRAPTDSKATGSTLKPEDDVKDSLQPKSDTADDFLSEDYLLPLSATRPPPTERRDTRRPEDRSASPRPLSTAETTQQYWEDAEGVRATPAEPPVSRTAGEMDGQTSSTRGGVESPATVIHVHLDRSVSEMPQTTTRPTQLPEAVDSHQTPFYESHTSLDLGTTSENPTPSHVSFPHISGIEEAAASTGSRSAAKLEGDASTGPGPDSTSQPAVTPLVGRRGSFPVTVPGAPAPPPPPLWPGPQATSVPASPSAASWVAGSWSDVSLRPPLGLTQRLAPVNELFPAAQCSTTCGLGAVWRTLACSTGSDADCDPAKRPAPAQQCYLRPCATWRVGEWSKVRARRLI